MVAVNVDFTIRWEHALELPPGWAEPSIVVSSRQGSLESLSLTYIVVMRRIASTRASTNWPRRMSRMADWCREMDRRPCWQYLRDRHPRAPPWRWRRQTVEQLLRFRVARCRRWGGPRGALRNRARVVAAMLGRARRTRRGLTDWFLGDGRGKRSSSRSWWAELVRDTGVSCV